MATSEARRLQLNAAKARWRAKNRTHDREYAAEYRHKNADDLRRKRQDSSPEERRRKAEIAMRWRRNNPEHAARLTAEWREANRDKLRVIRANRRARLKAAKGSHTVAEITKLANEQRFICASCPTSIVMAFDVDHVLPLVLGGSNYIANIQLLCPLCNRKKHAKHPDVWAREVASWRP